MKQAPNHKEATTVSKSNAKLSNKQKEAAPFFPRKPQFKLRIAASGDSYEAEANNIADRIMQKDGAPLTVRTKPVANQYNEDDSEKNVLENNDANYVSETSLSLIQDVLHTSGQPLDIMTRTFMEKRFGADFSHVTIHDDSKAHDSSARLNAHAYAYDNHIVFGSAQYRPDTLKGRWLLAHELAHTVQQQNGQKLIQKQPDKSLVDSEEAAKDFGSPPRLKTLFDIHSKAVPAIRPFVQKVSMAYDRALSDDVFFLSYIEPKADERMVNIKGDPVMDFLFDVYKALGKNKEAKALAEKKKYLPQKTAFYGAEFYKQVLQGDLSWLPAHDSIKDIFPSKFRTTYYLYFWGPDMAVQDLEGLGELKTALQEMLETAKDGAGLVQNERQYVAVNSLVQASKMRYNKLLARDNEERKLGTWNVLKKLNVAERYKDDGYWESSILNDVAFVEVDTLFRNVKSSVQKIAKEAGEFWRGITAPSKLVSENKLYEASLQTMFRKQAKIFKDVYEPKILHAATIFLRLSEGGDLPASKQLESQAQAAMKEFKQISLQSSIELIRTKQRKLKEGETTLPELYGLFIYMLEVGTFLLSQKSIDEPSRNFDIINRIKFARWLKYVGRMVGLNKLIELGEVVENPTEKTTQQRKIDGQEQKKSFIAFGAEHKWVSEALPPLQIFKKFNEDTAAIDESIKLATWMKYFFYFSMMQAEIEQLNVELNKADADLLAEELPETYNPLPKRIEDYLDEKMTGKDAIIPRRFILKDVFLSIIPEDNDKFLELLFAVGKSNPDNDKEKGTFQKIYEGNKEFDDTIHLLPTKATTHTDAGGIVAWVISDNAMQRFAEKISLSFQEHNIKIGTDFKTSLTAWLEDVGKTLSEKKANDADIAAIEKDIFNKWITLLEEPLSHLRRRALSQHRCVLLKHFFKPLWKACDETTRGIETWENPIKVIDMIIYIAGGHPWTFKKIEGKDEQAELKLQIATTMLELSDIMNEKLLHHGFFGAKTDRIGVIVKLLPHIRGAVTMEKEVLRYKDDLNLDYAIETHEQHVETLRKLDAGLLQILHNQYETDVKTLSENEKELAAYLTGGKIKPEDIPTKIYTGDWLKGTKAADRTRDKLEDRNSTEPLTKQKPILYEGKTYVLQEVFQNFYYRPAVSLDAGGVSWPNGMVENINPSTLILVDGDKETVVEKNDRKGTPLFSYNLVDPNDSTARQPIVVRDTHDEELNKLRNIIAFNSNIENLMVLKDVLETGIDWVKVPFYFIPGLGQAVLAGEIVTGVIQFLTSQDFQFLRKLINGDAKELLYKSYDLVTKHLNIDGLWDLLLNDDIPFPSFSEPQTETKDDKDFVTKTDSKLKKILLAFVRFGKKILNGLARIKNVINFAVKRIRSFVLNMPMLAALLAYVANNFYLLLGAVKLPDIFTGDDSKTEDAAPFSKAVQGVLNHLTELQVPRNLIPIDVIIDLVVRIALKSLKGPKGVIVGGVKTLLEKAGIYQKVLGLVAGQLEKTPINPNIYLNKLIADQIQPKVYEAGKAMAGELTTILQKLPGLKNLSFPVMPNVKEFEDSGHNIEQEEEETPESQAFRATGEDLSIDSPLPQHATGGNRLQKTQLDELANEYGHDFSHVRIHTDAEAEKANEYAGATALTSGSHIYFGSGLSTEEEPGKSIFKHELGHVLQQTGSRPVTAHHSDVPIDGKPGKGIVYDPQKEAAADQFAENKTSKNSDYNSSGGNAEGVQPKLKDMVLKFFKSVSSEHDFEAKHYVLRASSKARLSNANKLLAASIPGALKEAANKLTFSNAMLDGKEPITQFFKGQSSIYNYDYKDFVRLSKVKKKIGKEDEDETNWVLKKERLEVALEEYIAFETGIMLDIELKESESAIQITQFKVNNVFLENIRTNANIWEAVIKNTFLPEHRIGSKYKHPDDLDRYKSAAKLLIKQLDIHRVFAGKGFMFTDNFAKRVEEWLNPDLEGLHTGDIDDPIPILWYKKTREDYPQRITIKGKEYSMETSNPPTIQYAGENIPIGVNPIWIVRAHGGGIGYENATKLQRGRVDDTNVTPNAKKFRQAIAQPGGYKINDEDIDHVTDRGFTGPDSFDNLWPLKSSINRIPFVDQWYKNYKIEFLVPGNNGPVRHLAPLKDLPGRIFIVKGYSKMPERPGGRSPKKRK